MNDTHPEVEALRERLIQANLSDYVVAHETGIDRSWVTRFRSYVINKPSANYYLVLKNALDRLGK